MPIKPELKELFLFSVLFSFASALITIFEPVFFYQQAFSLAAIAVYYALHYTAYLFALPLGGAFAYRFGLERSLALSMPIFVLYFLVLAAIPWQPWLFWVAWPLLTLHKIFYWPAYHAEFAKFSDDHRRGAELSWMNNITYGVGILGPLIGGVVATRWGFPVLFVIAAATAIAAGLPLLKTRERYQIQRLNYIDPWQQLLRPANRRVVLGMLGMGEELVHLVYWPIFMFVIVGSANTLGLITAASILIMSIAGFFVGKLTDRYSRRVLLRLHMPFLALSFLFRPLASTPLLVLNTEILTKLSFIGTRIPMLAALYSTAKRVGPLRHALLFEMSLVIAKAATAWALVGVFTFFLPYTGLTIAFAAAAAMTLMYVFL